MKKNNKIKIKITQQGAPAINNGYVVEVGERVVALSVDLTSKYCNVSSSFSGSKGECGVVLRASERSLYLNEKSNREDITIIEFPDFEGWNVFAYYLGRYTLNVCLIKL